jgi:RND family efflux transporter MFP subunit
MRILLAISFLSSLLASVAAVAVEPVTVRPFSEIAIALEHQAAAYTESLNEAVISAEITARVMAFEVRPGEVVNRDQILVMLDDDSYRIQHASAVARLEIADAGLEMARIRAERARRLAPDRFVSEDQLLEAETRLRQAQAERSAAEQDLAQAALQLERTAIRAPFNGVVTTRLLGLGALASAGTPLIELIALDEIEVVANLAPGLVASLERAEEVHLAAGSRRWPLRLARVAPVISRGSRQQQVRLVFVGDPAPPGSDGHILWTDSAPALPADYIVRRNGALGVLVFDAAESRADFIELPTADAGRPAAVDLPADTLLIDQGRLRVQPGDQVRRQ